MTKELNLRFPVWVDFDSILTLTELGKLNTLEEKSFTDLTD